MQPAARTTARMDYRRARRGIDTVPFDPPGVARAADEGRRPMSPRRRRSHFGLQRLPFSKEVADAELWVPSR